MSDPERLSHPLVSDTTVSFGESGNDRRGRLSGVVQRVRAQLDATTMLGLALPIAFNAWFLRQFLRTATWPNDVPFHLSMAKWAAQRFEAGQIPLDGWFPRFSSGYPQFHMYQSLPHIITGAVGSLFGVEHVFNLFGYLLLVSWPISVWLAARAFGIDRLGATVAACAAPLLISPVGYGFEASSYTYLGSGLWSQIWGMWTFPLALAWSARSIADGRRFGRAGAALALTAAFHLPTAWFAFLAVGLLPFARPRELGKRLTRAIALGAGAVAMSSWVLAPLLSDQNFGLASEFNVNTHFQNSFGWRKVLGFVLTGDINDAGRLPVISILALAGLLAAVVAWRTKPIRWAREIPVLLLAGTILFIGRNPFGWLIDLLPASSMVFLHRYHIVIHLCSLLLAGAGVSALWRFANGAIAALGHRPRRIPAPVALGVSLVVLVPAAIDIAGNLRVDRNSVEWQYKADVAEGGELAALVSLAERRGGGRVYAGRTNNWGRSFTIGQAPVTIATAYYPIDQIGYNLRLSGLTGDLETYLNDAEVAQLRLLGIRYVILPPDQPPAPGLKLLAVRGRFRMFEVPGVDWLVPVNVIGPSLAVDRTSMGSKLLDYLGRAEWQEADRRLMHLLGTPNRTRTAPLVDPGGGAPGVVSSSHVDTSAGEFEGTVKMSRDGAVAVRSNWHPRFEALVDGKPVETMMVSPMELAVAVPKGTHTVEFRYRAYALYWLWFAVGACALAALIRWPRWGEPRAQRIRAVARRFVRRVQANRNAKRMEAAKAVGAALVVALTTACADPPHELGKPAAIASSAALDAGLLGEALTSDGTVSTFGSLVFADRPNFVVFVGGDGQESGPVVEKLMAAAKGDDKPMSVIGIGLPEVPADAAQAAATTGMATFQAARPSAFQDRFKVSTFPTIVVIDRTATVLGTFSGDDAAAEALAAAAE